MVCYSQFMLQKVTTTDDMLRVYQDRDLSSTVIVQASKGLDIRLGAATVHEGREWIEATVEDGSAGYILGPSARSHTTMGGTRLMFNLSDTSTANAISGLAAAGVGVATWWWPAVSDAESAKKAATYGATAAFFQAALTTILALMSIFKPLSKPLDYVGPNAIVDAFIFAFLGLMIQRKASRIAAVCAVVLYALELIYVGIQGRIGAVSVLWAVIFAWAFISSVRGTFAYHSHQERRHTGASEA